MQSAHQSRKVVQDLYSYLLRREPAAAELQTWETQVEKGLSFEALFYAFVGSPEFRERLGVRTGYAPGHYYSPVVNPDEVRNYVAAYNRISPSEIEGIYIPTHEMLEFWENNLSFIQKSPIAFELTVDNRYSYGGGPYPAGDGIMLRAMIGANKPKHIVEIGSGWSTACMLDALDEIDLRDCAIICIEPNPERLYSVLRKEDEKRIRLLKRNVQEVPLELFSILDRNDILFVDSTHVLKTGSDVHYELFHILPSLKRGVIIHCHDCQYPFEYPDEWIFKERFSWNEIYAVRAFLMFNGRFEIIFWNSLFQRLYADRIRATCPAYLVNSGSSLWLKTAGPDKAVLWRRGK